jgi:hypothetical protein
MLAATLVAPGHDKVVPLEPEFIVPQDGAEKQDCENMAAKRWLATHGQRYTEFDPVYLGDDLFSRQPLCQAVRDAGGHFFVCKPSSHPLIQEYLIGADPPVLEQAVKRGKQRFVHRYRWLRDVPLRDGRDALTVNWFEIEIINPRGEITYRNSFVTDLPVGPDNVVELAACGRARWKIENETFNILKNKGYNFEHSFGHGKQNPRGHSGEPEPAGLRHAHRLRHRRRALAQRTGQARASLQLLQQAGRDHDLPDLPVLGRSAPHARFC